MTKDDFTLRGSVEGLRIPHRKDWSRNVTENVGHVHNRSNGAGSNEDILLSLQ
jgi:hypothetical protein